jgi:UDP-N-acetylglucosamine diphosphorylase / glucose-1-phosphate thymidylyltransferase / UDP-N-acetylgalactosamine diphosphorylase / glucosamine-1-phosphate N-acetyltransferase / galactosamine-1-phosphate N-acetyltransferase
MNITILDKILSTMAPFGANGSLGELKLCGKSWRQLVEQRWQRNFGGSDDLTVTAELNFWPSEALLAQLHEVRGEFKVLDREGRCVASGKNMPHLNALGIDYHCQQNGGVSNCSKETAVFVVDSESLEVIYPWQLLDIQEMVLGDAQHGVINGIVHESAVINGNLDLGDGSILLAGVYIMGNVVIGEGCQIGPNCFIRGCTAIGNNCRIGQGAEIKNSIIMDDVKISHVSYIGDSIIGSGTDLGAGTMLANFRHDGKSNFSKVDGKLIDTGRDHFGAIIGENVHTGVNTSIYPGRKLSNNTFTRPGQIVDSDL